MISSSFGTTLSLLNKFQKHVPKLLICQLISNLLLEYGVRPKNREDSKDLDQNEPCKPSIERIYGVLLFVDISGFTSLAQRLTVDKLRIQINEYFSKILNIVFKHGGDVLKFAGDALYIVWPRTIIDQERCIYGSSADVQTKILMASVIDCGLEIIKKCSRQIVSLVASKSTDSNLSTMLAMSIGEDDPLRVSPKVVSKKAVQHAPITDEPTFSYLDVHAGISIGTMASLDVGVHDRWEHLIIGEPVSDVAEAEGDAARGELVISQLAHSFWHGDTKNNACGCVLTKSGCFRVNHSCVAQNEILLASCSVESGFEQDVRDYEESDTESLPTSPTGPRQRRQDEISVRVREGFTALSAQLAATKCITDISGKLKPHPITQPEHYENWINSCLLEDVFRHVHEADRMHYVLQCTNRRDDADSNIRDSVPAVMAAPSQCGSLFDLLVGEETSTSSACRMVETKNSPGNRGRTTSDGWFEVARRPSSSSTASNYSMISMHDTTLVGELRTVAVMFVGIHMEDTALFFEEESSAAKSSTRDCFVDSFNFLRRAETEVAADEALLARHQSCMEIVVRTLQSHGGQLRQFIVDDKGTVCIGTFGLRGSVSNDNAAASIDAANEIVQQLRQIGLEASIGLTLGKTYCGLVGSEERHEYSVMGPSTNLSARLMFSALPGEIRCGSAIRDQDRVHAFVPLGDICAKGYSRPVPTFMPLFFASKHSKSSDGASVHSSQCETGKSRAESWSCFGRDAEIEKLFCSLLPETVHSSSPLSPTVVSGVTMMVLTGSYGIGKTTLMNAFDRKVSTRRLLNQSRCNVCVFHNPPSSHSTAEPFSAWKPIICQAIQRLALSSRLDADGAFIDGSDMRGVYLQSLDSLLDGLSPELRAMKPLLGDARIIDPMPDNELTVGMARNERLANLSDLLIELLLNFSKSRGWRLLVIFDDLHCMDWASLDLIHRLWTREWTESDAGAAVSILVSHRPGVKSALDDTSERFLLHFPPGDERYHNLTLYPLTGSATRDLVSAVFARSGIRGVDDEVYARFFLKSGGNPFYACELAKAVRAKYMDTVHSRGSDNGGDGRCLDFLLADFESSRIEEIICYRFDQLEAACQLLLKMAAAACIYGGHFTLDMLVYVTTHYQQHQQYAMNSPHGALTDQDTEEVRESVLELFDEILRKNEFVHATELLACSLRSDETVEVQEPSDEPKLVDVARCAFTFIFELEKRSVYDLMLVSQKEVLHKFIARYLEGLHSSTPDALNTRNSSMLDEEGRQWEAASEWGPAMSCYYRSAMILDGLGSLVDCRRLLVSAHQILDRMREAAGVSGGVQLALSNSFRLEEEEEEDVSEDAERSRSKKVHNMTKLDVYNIFHGDSDLLQVGINICMRLGQVAIITALDNSIASKLFEECMKLLSLAVVGEEGDSKETDSSRVLKKRHSGLQARPSADKVRFFGVADFSPYFAVLVAVFHLYYTQALTDDAERTKQTRMADRFLLMAGADPKDAVHLLEVRHCQHQLLIAQRRFPKSTALVNEVHAQYRHELHHQVLCETYVTDRVPQLVASNAMMILMCGRLSQLNSSLRLLQSLFADLQDTVSLSWTVLPYCALLIRCGAAPLALEAYAKYTARATSDKRMNFIASLQDLGLLWMKLLAHSTRTECESPFDLSAFSDLLGRVLNMAFLQEISLHKQPLHSVIAVMYGSAGPELICAEICLLMSVCCDEKEQSGMYLNTALKYVDSSILICENSDHTLFALIYSLMAKARILMTLSASECDPTTTTAAELRVDAQTTLLRCVDLAQQCDFHLVVLQAGSLMERLGVDVEKGRALQRDAMGRIRELNEVEGQGQRGEDWGELTGLIKEMPVLEEL